MSKKRSLKEQKEYFTQPADGVRFVEESPAPEPEPEPEVSTEYDVDKLWEEAFENERIRKEKFEEEVARECLVNEDFRKEQLRAEKEHWEKQRESLKEDRHVSTEELIRMSSHERAIQHTDETVSTEELIRMSIDITNGAVKPPSSFDAAHRRAWAILLREISAISARGGVVDLPSEIP